MKTNHIKTLFILFVICAFTACKKDNQNEIEEQTEYKYMRLAISDATSKELLLLNPANGEIQKFEAKYPGAALYTSGSGRYFTLIHRENNFVENFDSGFEYHGDHVDFKGTPKFAFLTASIAKPTHFKSKGDEIITFNDGDATLSVANEKDFQVPGAQMQTINAGLVAHHGAMAKFDNGNYAITVKDGSAAGVLPERVKIINGAGLEVFPSTIQTKGIHGNASNGKVTLFGSASGVLVIKQDGTQELIEYPASFGTAWFGSILEAEVANKFIGYTAAIGAYTIDVNARKITPILATKEILQCKMDYASKYLHILMFDGTLKIYDMASGALQKEGKVLSVTDKAETKKPFLLASERYVYIILPKSGEVKQINTSDFNNMQSFKVNASPSSATLVGFENSQSH